MDVIDNQNVTDYKGRLVDRMRSKYPDRNFGGQDGQDGQDDLMQSLAEEFDALDAKLGEYDENNSKLTKFLSTSDKGAAFFNEWVRTGNPAAAFRKIYGQNAFEAITTPEGAQILAEIEAEEAKNKADKDARDAEVTENFRQSLEACRSWAESRGLSEEEGYDALTRLMDILSDAEDGKYSTELFDMAWKADHYDADVESARHEGEVNGRNAKIQESSLLRKQAAAVPQPVSGRSARMPETTSEAKPSWGSFLKQ